MSPSGLTILQIHNMKLCGYEKMRLVYMEWYGKMSIVIGEKWLASRVCVCMFCVCVYVYICIHIYTEKCEKGYTSNFKLNDYLRE